MNTKRTKAVERFAWPAAWITARWVHSEEIIRGRAYGGRARLCAGVLADDSQLWAMVYPGGARFLRISPATGGALEESYVGRQPTTNRPHALAGPRMERRDHVHMDDERMLLTMWTDTVQAVVNARRVA